MLKGPFTIVKEHEEMRQYWSGSFPPVAWLSQYYNMICRLLGGEYDSALNFVLKTKGKKVKVKARKERNKI